MSEGNPPTEASTDPTSRDEAATAMDSPGTGGTAAERTSPGGTVAHPPPARRSVWTPKQKLVRLLWAFTRPIWVAVPPLRPTLLRLFGGKVGEGCVLPASVEITIPWHVDLGDRVRIGDRVILYGLGMITIGRDTVLDYRVHICAGTHDMTDSRFPLLKPPITIGSGCCIGLDAYIGPGVTLGDGCTVAPRASVYKSFGDGVALVGNPAKPGEIVRPGDGGESS